MDQSNLPPAAKLAVLIEAGRAANPDLKQGSGTLYNAFRQEACALGFACLATGTARGDLGGWWTSNAQRHLDMPWSICNGVMALNDFAGSLDEIILSLREGELAKAEA